MSGRKHTAYLKFLADGVGALCAHELQLPDATALAALHGDEVLNGTQVDAELALQPLANLLRADGLRPLVEVDGFLVVVVEHLRNNVRILSVTIWIFNRLQIRLRNVLPAILIFLSSTATALRETGVAHLTIRHQHLTLRSPDGFCHMRVGGTRDALIALTVVVGADVEDGMLLAVVPTDEFIVLLDEREEVVAAVTVLLALLHLCQ